MSLSAVENLMASSGKKVHQTSILKFSKWWDDVTLPESEQVKVKTSLTYSVSTLFFPVTYEFVFDENEALSGRHIYD